MNKATQTAREIEARYQQVSRLVSVLETAPDLTTHITLQFRAKTPADAKRRGIRALMVRARMRAGDALRYVIVQETAADGRDIAAYHVFCNLDGDSCRQICARWDIGPHGVNEIDTRNRAALPAFIFDTSRAKAGRRLFNASRNIWDSVPARPASEAS